MKSIALYTMDLDNGRVVNHGLLLDDQGRFGRECNVMALGGDGAIYVGVTVFSKPGDPHFSHRFAWAGGDFYDHVLARLVLPEATPDR